MKKDTDKTKELEKELKAETKEKEEAVEELLEATVKIEALQEELLKEKVENAELHAEIEQEKEENREAIKENRKLRFSNSFMRVVLFVIFTVFVFLGGWYLGTKLVDLENYIYGDTPNPLSDKKISFSKENADKALNDLYSEVLSANGYLAHVLYNKDTSDTLDLYGDNFYKLSVVPKLEKDLYEDSMYYYVTYDNYLSEYEKLYGDTSGLEDLLLDSSMYPILLEDENKVLYDVYFDTGVEIKFSSEKVLYTAEDKIYTMTGTYEEVGGDFCLLKGSVVKGTFELKYKVNEDMTKYIVGMKITKSDITIEKNKD